MNTAGKKKSPNQPIVDSFNNQDENVYEYTKTEANAKNNRLDKLETLMNVDVSRIHTNNNVNNSINGPIRNIDNTEKRAKEKEKLWEDKRLKVNAIFKLL